MTFSRLIAFSEWLHVRTSAGIPIMINDDDTWLEFSHLISSIEAGILESEGEGARVWNEVER